MARSIWWYAWNAIFAPREATRLLLQEQHVTRAAYGLVIAGTVAAFASGMVSSIFVQAFFPLLAESDTPLFFSGIAGTISDNVIYALIGLATLPLGIAIWRHVFRFKEPRDAPLVAIAIGFASMLVLAPVSEAIFVPIGGVDGGLQLAVFGLFLCFCLWLTTFYFSEALGISYLRALAYNSLATFAVYALGVVAGIAYFWFAGSSEIPIEVISQ